MVDTDALHTNAGTRHAVQWTAKDNTWHITKDAGSVNRIIYAQVLPIVVYSLTDRAMSLLPHINSLISWAQENMNDILDDRKSYRKA